MAKTSQVNRNGKRERMAARDKGKARGAEGDRDGSHAAGGGSLQRLAEARPVAAQRRSRAGAPALRADRRGRGNYRKFKLCRIALRDLASSGQIPGMVKASW